MPIAAGCSCLGSKEKGKSLCVFSADEIFFHVSSSQLVEVSDVELMNKEG